MHMRLNFWSYFGLVWLQICLILALSKDRPGGYDDVDKQFDHSGHIHGDEAPHRKGLPLPHFFLIGAGKCGTTTLHELLVRHPEICRTEQKEVHYFSTAQKWQEGPQWYLQHFKNATDCTGRKYLIDSTPRYIRSEVAPMNLQKSYREKDLRQKKFMLIIREPVAREFSWYRHKVRACLHVMKRTIKNTKPKSRGGGGMNSKKFYGYLRKDLCADPSCMSLGCTDMPYKEELVRHPHLHLYSFDEYFHHGEVIPHDSIYLPQIHNWLKFISREQLFIINSDSLYADPTEIMKRLSKFLGLTQGWGENVQLPHLNDNIVPGTISCRVYDQMALLYRKHSQAVVKYINQKKAPYEPLFPSFKNTRSICGGESTSHRRTGSGNSRNHTTNTKPTKSFTERKYY
mmetsp:Transcript_21998/g.36856  ORF Transcript_21998/g.36856 Transcript_21998/m.36856 type:complete len:400 (+) Transcript_21998:177-1376(+)